jgi:hypothetical protein
VSSDETIALRLNDFYAGDNIFKDTPHYLEFSKLTWFINFHPEHEMWV